MPEYDVTLPMLDIQGNPVMHEGYLTILLRLVQKGHIATAAHYLERLEATGHNVTRLLAIAARELKLKERKP